MATAADIMSTNLTSIDAEATVGEAVDHILKEGVNGCVVIENGELAGFISELELFDVLFDLDLRSRPVSELMVPEVRTIDASTPLAHVAHAFLLKRFRLLPVVCEGKYVGIVSRRDLLEFSSKCDRAIRDPLTDLMPFLDEELV